MKTTEITFVALIAILIVVLATLFIMALSPQDAPIRQWFSQPQKALITTPTNQLHKPQQQPQRTPIPAAVYPTNFDVGELMFFQLVVRGNTLYFLGTTNLNAILNTPTNQPPIETAAEP